MADMEKLHVEGIDITEVREVDARDADLLTFQQVRRVSHVCHCGRHRCARRKEQVIVFFSHSRALIFDDRLDPQKAEVARLLEGSVLDVMQVQLNSLSSSLHFSLCSLL